MGFVNRHGTRQGMRGFPSIGARLALMVHPTPSFRCKHRAQILPYALPIPPGYFFSNRIFFYFEPRSLLEFCEHSVSNFLIQAALQRVEDSSMAEEIVGAISNHALDLLRARRAGVLWRAAQACVRLRLKPRIQTKLLEDVGAAVLAGHTGAAPLPLRAGDEAHAEAEIWKGGVDKKDSRATPDLFKSAREWVPALLSPRLPGEGGGERSGSSGPDRLFLNVPGARIIQNALLFDPPVAAPVLKAVSALPEAVLAAVARDNIGSRCLLDPILDEAAAEGTRRGGRNKTRNKPAEDAKRTILRAFRGHLVAMACDRVGWHVVLKCFRGADMKDKRYVYRSWLLTILALIESVQTFNIPEKTFYGLQANINCNLKGDE